MILVAYKRVEEGRAKLEEVARRAFPSRENDSYIGEISERKNQASAKESLAALSLLSELLKNLAAETEKLVLRRDENGKPFFEGGEFDFSVSHSKGIVAVALSDTGAVGIDVEASKMTDDRAKRLFERYFSDGGSSAPSREDFLRLWVRTEAYVKLCGMTLADGLRSEIPDGVNFYDFEICGFPASLSYFENQTVEFYTNTNEI